MAFRNPVVGGTTLIRPAIHSPNYVPGVSGWSINRDGSAEFADLTVRGSFSTGVAPANRVSIDSIGQPSVKFYTNGLADPGEIYSYTRTSPGESNAVGLIYQAGPNLLDSNRQMKFILDNGNVIFGYDASAPTFRGAMLWLSQDNSGSDNHTVDIGIVDQAASVDTRISMIPGGIATFGADILLRGLNTATRVVDGKVVTAGPTDTTSNSTTDVNISTANATNVAVIAGQAYRATVLVSFLSSVAADRAQFKLWSGTPGVGTQLGQSNNRKCNAAAAAFENSVLVFIWRASTTETISNLNLSVNRLSGTGTITVRIAPDSYSMVVEEIGDADMIGGL